MTFLSVVFKTPPTPDMLGCVRIVCENHIRSVYHVGLTKLDEVLAAPEPKQIVIVGNAFTQATLMASYLCAHFASDDMLTDVTGFSDIEKTFKERLGGSTLFLIPSINVDNYINGAASRASRITQSVTNFMKSRGCQDADLVLVADACENVGDWKTALAGIYQDRCVIA